jgi:sugar/nucleoside kinase (ribokinase family)
VNSMSTDLVAFGSIVLADLMLVDKFPLINTGTEIKTTAKYLSDDAVIVATLLSQWGMKAGLICTEIPSDDQGKHILNMLNELNIQGEFRLSPYAIKPYEVTISDSLGNRTYFWRRDEELLNSLDTANLNIIKNSKFLYVDWYDGDHILRPISVANCHDVPVFLNLEYGHQNQFALEKYVKASTIVQAITDSQQLHFLNAENIANTILEYGPKIVIVTMAEKGCLVTDGNQYLKVYPPSDIFVLDVNGAGATFSAAFLYGFLNGWDLQDISRFAVASAALKCTEIGPKAFPVDKIKKLSSLLAIDSW